MNLISSKTMICGFFFSLTGKKPRPEELNKRIIIGTILLEMELALH
jgi:hypothetical protein